MPSSIWAPEVQAVLADAESMRPKRVQAGDRFREVSTPFPSPADWRDQLIYFLLIDRFHNPAGAPAHRPWDEEYDGFQGGTFNGVRAQLDYLQQLGVGALWLSPVVKNCQYEASTYHGYGAQDFLQLDPRFASNLGAARANPQLAEDELRTLVDEAHARDMYIIFDIVLNHAGDIFEYAGYGSAAPWRDSPYEIRWRDANGIGRPDWTEAPQNPPADAAVWPRELCRNELFRRQGRGAKRAAISSLSRNWSPVPLQCVIPSSALTNISSPSMM